MDNSDYDISIYENDRYLIGIFSIKLIFFIIVSEGAVRNDVSTSGGRESDKMRTINDIKFLPYN